MSALIIGGTGTLGQELVRQMLLENPRKPITIMSRDELKQQVMRRAFGDYRSVRYAIGDVRDRSAVDRVVRHDTDVIYHVAAMKHIDVCEANPIEAVKTNVEGTFNVASVALERCVPRVVFSSTDKAVLPVVRLAAAVARAVGVTTYHVNNVGMRPGEKVHEAIDWNQQMGLITSDTAPQYTDAELDDLVRPLFAEKAA